MKSYDVIAAIVWKESFNSDVVNITMRLKDVNNLEAYLKKTLARWQVHIDHVQAIPQYDSCFYCANVMTETHQSVENASVLEKAIVYMFFSPLMYIVYGPCMLFQSMVGQQYDIHVHIKRNV